MNERDRDRFYGPGGDEWGDDDADLEIEPPDADVLAGEERRARDAVESSKLAIDVDEIYRRTNPHPDHELPFERLRKFRFQFRVKYLLVAMLVASLLLTMWRWEILGAVLVVMLLAAIVGTFAFKEYQEQRHWVDVEREWDEKYERRRQFLESRLRPPADRADQPTIYDDLPFDGVPPAAPAPLSNKTDQVWQEAMAAQRFRFQFSLWQLLVAMTCAAVVFGLVRVLGGPNIAATLLGFVVLGGLVVHTLSGDLPQSVVMAWWVLLFLYVALSLAAVVRVAL